MSNKNNVSSDLQGITSLISDATIGVTDLVEAMHKRVTHPPFLPSTPIQHLITKIAGFTFNNIRWTTKFISKNSNKVWGKLNTVLGKIEVTKDREAIIAVLNGVIGDHLEKNDNPLQIKMNFRYNAKPIAIDKKNLEKTYANISGKILLMIHGSCMNDLQWTKEQHNHGELLATELNKTPIYLHYNTGLHVSTNGQEFNNLLEELVQQWPVPVEEIIIVAHSMGGLVSRSALYYAENQQKKWVKHLKKIIFIGTPHHGAPMEKAGNIIDVVLENIAYAKPFARLGKIRSAGVTDLRYGNLVDEDWQDFDRFKMNGDKRKSIPIPTKIKCYSLAGIVGKEAKTIKSKLLGDNMVGVKSALGKHKNASKNIFSEMTDTYIVNECNHTDLLSNLKVYNKIKSWIAS